MGLNDIPLGERVHIAFFGCRNAGKSSLINAFSGQSLSIVSETKGTTTDPVQKSMELLPLGPVVLIDTPGIDDEGELGALRIERAEQVLRKTDIALLVVDAALGLSGEDERLLALFKERNIPYILVYNKADLLEGEPDGGERGIDRADGLHNAEYPDKSSIIYVSAKTGQNIHELKELTAGLLKELPSENKLIGDLVHPGDRIILVVPIDKAAPKGRLILPQQQVIRDALDHGAIPLICRDTELSETLSCLKETPSMVITDSQVFSEVDAIVPGEIPLTSFSILMARYKGNLAPSVSGASRIRELSDGDRVLISEGCTHHRQCGDIGSVKLPALLQKFTGKELSISLSSGTEFPKDLQEYRLILHCGACMLNPAEARARYKMAEEQGVPITNYGIAIAYVKGILERSLSVFSGQFCSKYHSFNLQKDVSLI